MPSVSNTSFLIGQRLELRADQQWLPSRVEDIDGSELLTVAWPMDRARRLLPLKVGDKLELAGSAQDAHYAATVRVEQAKQEPVPLLTVRIVGGWQRSQRREAVRMAVAIRPRRAVRLVGDEEQPLRIGITTISATGVQVRSLDELRVGDRLEVAFPLAERELHVQARVKRVQLVEKVWQAGCAFEQLADRMAKEILQFIFAQQRAELARMRKVS
jgi:c-di-GMP-binding flagellar brake protein YcgR